MNKHTKLRRELAKEFFDHCILKMPRSFVEGFVFGSVAKNKATEKSDIDIIMVIHKIDYKELQIVNTPEELQKREMMWNCTWDMHEAYIKAQEIEEEYKIPISIYLHFAEDEMEEKIYLNRKVAKPFIELVKGSIFQKALP